MEQNVGDIYTLILKMGSDQIYFNKHCEKYFILYNSFV